ncbi:hypothetical protein OS493_035826 [Desmophyllum pertusum]|uniref:EF-hand domain-containing protein n=1 Tax=Desmophyllum pertusum TaxID=174260 RepID=A0A9W9Y7H6_9CNID|nr:hypothetical protein OS493_035826 [Desmophyllum pertusum]
MENNFVSKNKFADLEEVEDEVTPPFIRIYSIPTKTGEHKDETDDNSGGSRVSSPVEMARDRLSQNLSNSCGSEGSWAFRAEDIAEEFPSLEVRHEAMKRVFQSLDHQNDGRTSRLETSRTLRAITIKLRLADLTKGTTQNFIPNFKRLSRKECLTI